MSEGTKPAELFNILGHIRHLDNEEYIITCSIWYWFLDYDEFCETMVSPLLMLVFA